MKGIRNSAVLFVLLFPHPGFAHKNAELTIDSTGNILGLPEYVQPAIFSATDRTFSVKEKLFSAPKCVDQYLSGKILRITGTWFHHQTEEPPHIVITIAGQNKDSIYSVPFSLLTAKPLYVVETLSVTDKLDDGKKIVFDQKCQDEIDGSISGIDF